MIEPVHFVFAGREVEYAATSSEVDSDLDVVVGDVGITVVSHVLFPPWSPVDLVGLLGRWSLCRHFLRFFCFTACGQHNCQQTECHDC